MKNLWSDILVPAAIVSLTLAGTVGVESARVASRAPVFAALRQLPPDSLHTDTSALPPADSLKAQADSLRQAADTIALQDAADSLDEDFFFFGEDQNADTIPWVDPRDTVKVPDSLRITDPFLYKWYVAVKDQKVHRIVVDSLKNAGDSLDWPRIDSLYLADSTAIATERFNRWYASLSRAERKRYDYEQQLPAILRRLDSIQQIKDSIKARRDSIRENTPRVLSTPFLPDSLHFKRLVTWHHEPHFNSIEPFEWDTTANHHFNDFPYMKEDVGGVFLGMPGSAVETYNFFRRGRVESTSFFEPYESWTYSPSTLPMYNTKTPYTELQYDGNLLNSSTKASDNVRIFTTQNILPSLNIAMEFKRYGGPGVLQLEETNNKTAFVAANYLGRHYMAHGGFIHNAVSRVENGGVQDIMWVRDTTVDVREIAVNLSKAANKYKKNTWFLDQTVRIPFAFIDKLRHRGDSTWTTPPDSVLVDMTTAFIGTSTEYTVYGKYYTDAIASSDLAGTAFFHGNNYLHPAQSADSLGVMRLENRLFVAIQPWKRDAIVSRIQGGLGNRYQTFYLLEPEDYLMNPRTHSWNSFYTYAGAEGGIGKYFSWNAFGQYTFAGAEANDFLLRGSARLNLYPFRRHRNSPVQLHALFETSLREPGYYEQHFSSNHYRWENDFSKKSVTRLTAGVAIPRWDLKLDAGYALLSGNTWYDTLGIVRQNTQPMSVLSLSLEKNFQIGKLVHLDNKVLLQYSSKPEVLPLPLLALNLRYYIQFPIVRDDVMRMQLGINGFYNTSWYLPAFNPVTGTFMAQNVYAYGNVPRFDVFANIQWKKACIFIKLENAGQGWPAEKHDYFSAHGYIHTTRYVKVGIMWPFYPSLGKNKTLSDRAGSGMGGSGGGGMMGGGMMGGLGRGLTGRSN